MNWSKAKTILIVAFLLLDLFLAYQLLYQPPSVWREIEDPAGIAQLSRQVLSEYFNIKLEARALPTTVPAAPLKKVRRQHVNSLEVARTVLGPDVYWAVIKNSKGEKRVFAEDKQRLERVVSAIKRGKPHHEPRILYVSNNSVIEFEGPSKDTLSRQALKLLQEGESNLQVSLEESLRQELARITGLVFDDAVLDTIEQRNGQYVITFIQRIEWPVYGLHGYTTVTVDGHGRIVHWVRSWLEEVADKTESPQLLSAADALLRYVSQYSARDFSIVNVELVYYGYDDMRALEVLGPGDNLRSWDLTPVWRFQLADGRLLYVNAFDGRKEVNPLTPLTADNSWDDLGD